MLLAVDIGNTNIKFGVFDGERLVSKLSIPTIKNTSADALARVVTPRIPQPVSSVLICSVVPEIEAAMSDFLTASYGVATVFVTNDIDLGLAIKYEPLSDAGTDRLVNAFSAVERYGAPCIVCSFGTALTIDVVDGDRVLIGGLIAPGMNILMAALGSMGSRLSEVEIEKPENVIQNTTVGSIQSGIVYGYFGLADSLLARVKAEIGFPAQIIATGGYARLVAENTARIDIIDDDLLLAGLQKLQKRLYQA